MPACSGQAKSGAPSTYLTETDEVPKTRIKQVVSSGSLVALAWALSCWQALLDLGSRRAQISAEPALISLQIAVVLSAVLLCAIGARTIEGRSVGAVKRTAIWRLWLSVLTVLSLIGLRLLISPLEPTVLWLTPALLLPPALLSVELLSIFRFGARFSRQALEKLASTWCALAALLLAAIAAGPISWAQVPVRIIELRAISLSVFLIALAAMIAAAYGQRASTCIRFFAIAAAGAFAGFWTSELDNSLARNWPIYLSALLILCSLLVTQDALQAVGSHSRTLRSSVAQLARRWAKQVYRTARRALRVCGAGWERLEIFCSSAVPFSKPRLSRSDRYAAAVMAALAGVYVGGGALWSYRMGWQPTAHSATAMARAFDVGTVNHPLVGMSTSLGKVGSASHPGPLSLDLLAPFVRLLGVQNGARAAAVFVALTCWAVSVWSAWRAAGRVAAIAAWMMCAVVLQVAAFGAVWEANNLTITTLAMFAAVVASWAAASGTWRAWWWAVGLSSFCAQSYLPHALIVLGPVLWAGLAVAGAVRVSSDPDLVRRGRQALRVGWGIAIVAWFQPALDVVINKGGNVRELITEISNPRPPVGPIGFPRAIAWICSVPPRWGEITKSFAQAGTANELIKGPFITGAIVFVSLGILWWRTRKTTPPQERQLRIITLLVLIGAGINTTQLPQDFLRAFQIGWLVVASACLWYAVGVSAVLALQRRLAEVTSERVSELLKIGAFSGCALVVLAAGFARPDRIEDVKSRPFTIDAMVQPAVDQTMEKVDITRPVLVVGLDSRLVESSTDTIVSNLIVSGLDTRSESFAQHYGTRRVVKKWKGPMLFVTSALAPVKPNGKLLASVSMPDWSKQEFDALAQQVAQQAKKGPPVRLEPWAQDALPHYLAGWLGTDTCRIATEIRRGTYPVASLPPGLLLTLYGDRAVARPTLPDALQEEASGMVGQAPLQVWSVHQKTETATDTATLLRDGSHCTAA